MNFSELAFKAKPVRNARGQIALYDIFVQKKGGVELAQRGFSQIKRRPDNRWDVRSHDIEFSEAVVRKIHSFEHLFGQDFPHGLPLEYALVAFKCSYYWYYHQQDEINEEFEECVINGTFEQIKELMNRLNEGD